MIYCFKRDNILLYRLGMGKLGGEGIYFNSLERNKVFGQDVVSSGDEN